MSETAWRELSFEEKLSWYWHRTNDLVIQHEGLFDSKLTLYTHELNDVEKLKEIAEFLNLDSERLPIPAHTNKFFATDNRLWQTLPPEELLHHHRRLNNFDMNKAFFEEKYGVEYFVDHEIKKYKQEHSPERLEYLKGLVDKITQAIND